MTINPPPTDPAPLIARKEAHLDLALQDRTRRRRKASGLQAFDFVHCALPEINLTQVDLATSLFGKPLRAPFLISSMTGGPTRAAKINRNLAIAAQELGIGLGVGSQRVALEGADQQQGKAGLGQELRALAPDITLFGNIGAAQLAGPGALARAQQAVDMIGADGIFIHLNPLQEALQPEGDTDWRGLLAGIEAVCKGLDVPVIAKEIGCGICAATAQRLVDAGVSGIDVAGAGGTSWAWIESQRHAHPSSRQFAADFADWGIPTADTIRQVRAACPHLPLIGSGGIQNGIDAAKALHLGADLVAMAGATLAPALESPDAVIDYFKHLIQQLRITCFATGSTDIAALRHAPTMAASAG